MQLEHVLGGLLYPGRSHFKIVAKIVQIGSLEEEFPLRCAFHELLKRGRDYENDVV